MNNWSFIGKVIDPSVYDLKFASVPFGYLLSDGSFRMYFSSRDELNRSEVYTCVIDLENVQEEPKKIEKINLAFGKAGFFDSNGIMATSIINIDGVFHMYYIGWNLAIDVPFRNAIGLALSGDGVNFTKYSNGPILDRSIHDPCFTASCEVLKKDDSFLMYYLSCVDWIPMGINRYKHKYHIKVAESVDGKEWKRNGEVAIDFKSGHEYAISVPRYVENVESKYLYYSCRASETNENYSLGRAIFKNSWVRLDDVTLDKVSGSNDQMDCYPFIIKFKNKFLLFHNGNNYGETGIFVSEAESL